MQITDLLIDGVAITRRNADGTIERVHPSELIGKNFEIVSSSYCSFQDIKDEFEQS